jgi:gliding motility-associated-like protein/uncharacterized repeat protein (TIGR01451 family)
MNYNRLQFLLIFLGLFIQSSLAQVTPNINSGNPAFPFPQFLDYGPGRKSLASHNAPGMTHAEMELRTREAWQLVCNNTSKYPGTVVSGVQYLYPTAPNHCTCVEGDGYYLLGAAVMGDKTFFDGYYMWAHDRAFQGVKRFVDGEITTPGYNYNKGLSGAGSLGAGTGVKGGGINGNSATDGDVDVALALLIAYKQWGEHSGIILSNNGWGGKEINYKEEALSYIRAMVDTALFAPALPEKKYISGDVGFDGYLKGGDSQGELTDWALTNGYQGMKAQVGQQNYYYDYSAPAWFKAFRNLLEKENDNPFYISQYKRVEASCDWLMGLHYSKSNKNIPYLGKVNWEGGNNFSFANYIPDGEDFRGPWRTIMNYVWYGNPTYTWDPVTHQVKENTPNSFEYDMGLRYSKFLKNNQDAPWNNPCRNIGDLKPNLTFKGPYTLLNGYKPDGSLNGGSFPLNWIHGTGAGSAIIGQDFELMGEMFRHCVIAWDAATGQNLDSRPIYFHEWFRLLGMLTLSGNFHSPENMIARPNLKVYHKVDKTFGFTGDQMTFTVSFRNYGSVDAAGTVVKFGIPKGFQYVSSTKGTLSGDSVVWNVGAVKGFRTGGLAATIDSMKITVKVGPTASGRYCTNATIACTNGLGWTSDEYPNNITAVMERNCVDIVKRALKIEKTASRKLVNPSSNPDVVYKIKFENSSDAGWINGGRPGVRMAFAHNDLATPSDNADIELKFRLFHDAAEPYIDYGNYRVSYFMNDPNIKGYSTAGGTTTWGIQNSIAEGVDKNLVKVTHEQIVPGSDQYGSWNQRIVLQFSPQLATITQHLQQYTGSPSMVHEGGMASLRGVWRLFSNNYIKVDWTDDWSWNATFKDASDGIYYPIGDDYTDPDNPGLPIDSWHKSACQTTTKIVKNVLVEEWDGYVWRRVLGNGPIPGRDIPDVVVTDTLPAGVKLKNFIRQTALGITATTSTLGDGRTVIKWSIPRMQVNQKDSLVYTATIAGTCPGADKLVINKAWIEGSSESAIYEADTVTVTCNAVTICPDPTTLTKSSDKLTYALNDPVTYTLKYTQTQGSIADPDLSTSSDWTAQSGSMSNATFGSGKASIGQINGGNLVLTHDYSYGLNTLGDGIEGTMQITSYAKAAIVVRHAGGTYNNGVFVVIKPAYPSTVDVYNGTTKVGSGTFPDQTPPSIDFRIKLSGNKLDLWIGPTPTAFSGAPSMSFTGITEQAGWAGFARGTTIGDESGTGTITSWRTHLDAAFDVEITDPVPSGITSPSAISSPGTSNAGVITWKLATGKTPMLYGDKKDLSWKGVYSECKKVTNVAYVNTKGITGNQLGVCYDITCASVVCTLKGGKIGTGRTICYNTAPPAFTEITPASGGTGYTYSWQSSENLVNWTDIPSTNSTTYTSPALSDTTYFRRRVRSAGCTDAYSDTITIVVLPELKAPVIAADQILCSGDPAAPLTITTNPAGASGTYARQWQRSADNLSFNDIPSASAETYNPGIMLTPSWYRLKITSATCTPVYSGSVAITINPSTTTSVSINNPGAICNGQSVTFTATPSGQGTTPKYLWYKNGTLLSAETKATYTTSTLINGDKIKAALISSATCPSPDTAVSAEITIQVTTTAAASVSINDPGEVCSGKAITFTAVPVNGGTPSYKWYLNDVEIENETTDKYTSSSLANGDKIRAEMTATSSCASTDPAVSNEVTMKIITPAVVSVAINEPDAVCAGQPVTITAVPQNGGSPIYKWYRNNNQIANATSDVLTSSTLADGDKIKAEMTTSLTCASPQSAVSNEVTIKITTAAVASVTIEEPEAVCAGQAVTITALPQNEGTAPVYKWYRNNNLVANATSDVFTSSTLADGDKIKVEMTSGSSCASPKPALSSEVTVTINPVVEPSVSIETPASTICAGDLVSFTVKNIQGEGNDPEYQWFVNDLPENGETGNTFESSTLADQAKVKLQVTSSDKCASPLIAESEVITITHSTSVEPSVTIGVEGDGSTTLCEGQTVKLKIISSPGGGSNPSFKWKLNNNNIPSATGSSYTPSVIADGDKYSAEMTTSSSCATSPVATSEELAFSVQTKVTPTVKITVDPENSFCKGDNLNFSIINEENQGTDPVYQWLKNDVAIPRATGRTYSSSALSDNDRISLTLTSSESCVTTATATADEISLTQNPAPAAEITASSESFCSYQTLELNAPDIQGAEYEWILNNTPLTEASGNKYTTNVAGNYQVRITSAKGCDSLSEVFTISEIPALPVSVKPKNAATCPDKSPVLASSVSDRRFTYSWIDENDEIVKNNDSLYTPEKSGAYRVIVSSGICSDTSAEFTVNILTPSVPDITGPEFPICESKGIIYTISEPTAGSTYKWTVPADAKVVSGEGTSSVTVDFGTSDGKITAMEMFSPTCPGLKGEINIALERCDFIAAFTADKTSICPGESVTFTSTSGGITENTSYSWDFGNGQTSEDINPEPVEYSQPGSYTVTLTITDGISKTETKSNYITVNSVQSISNIEGPGESCLYGHGTYSVTQHAGYTYKWSVNNDQLLSASGNTAVIGFNNPGTTEITVSYISRESCPGDTVTKTVNVKSVPQVRLSTPATHICHNGKATIAALGANPGSAYNWVRDNNTIPGAVTSVYNVTLPGKYWVIIRSGTCSYNSDTITVTGSDLVADAGPDQMIQLGNSAQLNVVANATVKAYSWKPAGTAPVQNPTVRPSVTVDYIVTVTDLLGCTASDTVRVKVVSPLFIPNAFTPNADGVHDEWVIEGTERMEGFSVQVFNRWGNLVFDSSKEEGWWNGTRNGEMLPVSTYYYAIKYKENGEEKTEAGSVLLAR